MKGIKIYLTSKPADCLTFDKVVSYKFKKGFLCMEIVDGTYICYNLSRIERFEVT